MMRKTGTNAEFSLEQRRRWLQGGGLVATTLVSGSILQACATPTAAEQTPQARRDTFPAFFDAAPTLLVRDPLADLLGAAQQGLIEYRYADAVRLAGHSCPTVAGSYLMVLHGLRALYGADVPIRGEIEVFMRDARDSGITGVIATVAQLLTGAAAETGFQGLGAGHRFSRQNLLHFSHKMKGLLALRRRDSGKAVQVQINHDVVPADEEMKALLPRAVAGKASAAELRRFGELWQERVKKMLIDHAQDPRLIQVSPWVAV